MEVWRGCGRWSEHAICRTRCSERVEMVVVVDDDDCDGSGSDVGGNVCRCFCEFIFIRKSFRGSYGLIIDDDLTLSFSLHVVLSSPKTTIECVLFHRHKATGVFALSAYIYYYQPLYYGINALLDR